MVVAQLNALSWLFYAADVASGLVGSCIFLTVVSFIGMVLCIILGHVAKHDASFGREGERKDAANAAGSLFHGAFALGFVCAIFWSVAVFVPSRQTIYLIAASEVGQRVATSQPVSDIAKEAEEILRGFMRKAKQDLMPAAEKK